MSYKAHDEAMRRGFGPSDSVCLSGSRGGYGADRGAAGTGSGPALGRFGGAARDGVRYPSAGYRTAAGEGAAPRDGLRVALGAAGTGGFLVRPPLTRVVFGAG